MHKKAQITAFMIIGLLAVLMLAFVVVFASTIRNAQVGQAYKQVLLGADDMRQVRDYADSCLKQKADLIISVIGRQGGIVPREDYRYPTADKDGYKVAYFLKSKKLYIPKIPALQKKLANLTKSEFYKCVQQDIFDSIKVEAPKVDGSAFISMENVVFFLNTTVLIKKGAFRSSLNRFYYTSPVKLAYLIEKASMLASLIKAANTDPENPGAFDISDRYSKKIDFSSELVIACYHQEGSEKFITLTQYGSQKGKVFEFTFALDGLVSGVCTKSPFVVADS